MPRLSWSCHAISKGSRRGGNTCKGGIEKEYVDMHRALGLVAMWSAGKGVEATSNQWMVFTRSVQCCWIDSPRPINSDPHAVG